MRTIPGMVILNPSDHYEMKAAVRAAIEHKGPCYIRLGRLAVESINNGDDYRFELGKGITLCEGTDVTIVATGLMVAEAVKAAKALEAEASARRSSTSTRSSRLTRSLFSRRRKDRPCRHGGGAQHHRRPRRGCFGGAFREVPDAGHTHRRQRRVRPPGPAVDLLKEFGLSAEHIAEVVREKLGK